MKSIFTILICTLSIFSKTYILDSTISNSIINSNNIGEKGSGKIVNKTVIPKTSFNKIAIDISANIIIRNSSKNNIYIRTDDNIIDKILVYVKNGTLFIATNNTINPTKKLSIIVNNHLLEKLTIDGASDITVKSYKLDALSIYIDGASDILFENNNINRLNINADGSYDINLLKSKVNKAYIKADGSGNIKINIKDYMDISIMGTVEIKYVGNPKIKKYIDGVADLIKIR